MAQELLHYIQNLDSFWIILIAGFFSFFENIFPPLPGDVIVTFCSFLLKDNGPLNLSILLSLCILNSTIGFLCLYWFGSKLEHKIYSLKWVKKSSLVKTQKWFEKFGIPLIALNRFFPGIRSVIALYSGVAKLNIKKVLFYSFLSSALYNSALIFIGQALAKRKAAIHSLISSFTLNSALVATLLCVIIIIYLKYKHENKNH